MISHLKNSLVKKIRRSRYAFAHEALFPFRRVFCFLEFFTRHSQLFIRLSDKKKTDRRTSSKSETETSSESRYFFHKLGPLTHNPDPIEARAHHLPSARAKTIFTARIQTARIKTLTRRIMNISYPHARRRRALV